MSIKQCFLFLEAAEDSTTNFRLGAWNQTASLTDQLFIYSNLLMLKNSNLYLIAQYQGQSYFSGTPR